MAITERATVRPPQLDYGSYYEVQVKSRTCAGSQTIGSMFGAYYGS